ncbi:unnamed protein product [Dibothriocephalus latus]|uniref:C2H2-type domain-containing protein n=1 Tax=Dibothriocephalus latus TaxID=60516 RepID=A0A3P7QET5_DIBLA|nr:unnamed protein product [Dibothriocephalus latus]
MGSPISGFIAELVLQDPKKIAVSQQPPVIWFRCLGDRRRVRVCPPIWHAVSCIKDVSEATERIAAGLGVAIANRVKPTMRSLIMRIKDRLNPCEQSGVVYRTTSQNCSRKYIRQTGSILGSHIREHKRAVQRGDESSQVAAHTYNSGHEFNYVAARVIAHVGNKTGRELVEAWVSDENSFNRFIDLAPANIALRGHLWKDGTII